MNRIFESLRPLIRATVNHAGLVVVVAVILSFIGIYNASKLSIDTDFSKLIPSASPSVQAIERLREEVGGESPVDVVIESPRSEEHTSELQSRGHLVCRLLLEKQNKT